MSERKGLSKGTTKKKPDVKLTPFEEASRDRILAMDLALGRLSKPSAAPPIGHGGGRRLPPLLTASRSEDREAELAALLRETLHEGQSPVSAASPQSDGVLDLSGCGIVISDFPRIIDVLSMCPHIHTLDVRANSVDAPFLSKVVDIVRGNHRICSVLFDSELSTSRASADATTTSHSLKCDPYIATIEEVCVQNRAVCEAALQRESLAARERFAQEQYTALLSNLASLSALESKGRQDLERQSDALRVAIGKEHKSCLLRLASSLRRKLQLVTYQRQLEVMVQREEDARDCIVASTQQELSLLLQADCGFRRRFATQHEATERQQQKKEETASWVLARRAEKHRFACERAAREALFDAEANARVVVAGEWEQHVASLVQSRDASAAQAKASEDARLEKARREEQMRKRLEDQARERAEKEEAQRQKALREFLLKQQQAREKLETDAGIVRKSLRSLEAALVGCLMRVATVWFAYLQARFDAERATSAYCKLLVELPMAKLQLPYQYVSGDRYAPHLFVAEDASEWLQVLSPSNFHAAHLNPHRKDHHHVVPRISLMMSPESRTGGAAESLATPPPGSPSLGSPTYPDPPSSIPASPSSGAGSPAAVLFQIGMREAWLNAVKTAQYEFRTRVSKFESTKQSGRSKVAEELKMVRAAINQHRVEYARWRWQVAAQGSSSTVPLASPSASGASKVLATSAAQAAPAADPFVPPEPLADPLQKTDEATGLQLASALDVYVAEMAGFGKHQAFVADYIPLQLEEEDVRLNQQGAACDGAAQQPTKELPAATLRILKEQIQECSIACKVTNGSVKDHLRFEIPAAHGEESCSGGAGTWTSSVPQPRKRFDNNFLHTKVSAFRTVATVHQQHHQHHGSVLSPQPHLPMHADGAIVAAANARQRRIELEAAAEATKDPLDPTAGEEIDYAALHIAKLQHEYLSSEAFQSALSSSLEPIEELQEPQLPGPELTESLLHDLAATCEYAPCNDVELTYAAPSACGTPRPPVPDLVESGGAVGDAAEPEAAAAASTDAAPGGGPHPPAEANTGVVVGGNIVSRNPAIVDEVTQFFSTVEFYATCDAPEGIRWVQLSIALRTAVDLSLHTNAFHVWQRLLRGQQAPMDCVVEREERLLGAIPILVLRPRIPKTLYVPQCRVVLTKADHSVSAATAVGSGGTGKPLQLLAPKDVEFVAKSIDSSRAATLQPAPPPLHVDLGPSLGLLGSEMHVVVNTLAGSRAAAAPDIQLCFFSDSRLWMCVVDQISLKRERSPLGTIFFSATGDGQQGIPIMEVVSGSLQPCGTAPLSSSSAVIQAAKRLSRKVSNVALNSGRRVSAPNTSRSDTTSKNAVAFRVESNLVSPQMAAECVQRMCVAAGSNCGSPSGSSVPFSKSSQPTTPRCAPVTDTQRNIAMTSRIDVFLRAPQFTRDGESASVPSTPRDEQQSPVTHSAASYAVLNHRVMRMDVPLVSLHVESLPYAPAPHQQYFDANARSLLNPMSFPCGAYLLRSSESPPVYLHQTSDNAQHKVIAPFRSCALRIMMPDESTALDPAVRWTMTIATSSGEEDRVTSGATPIGTSRTDTPTAAGSNRIPPQEDHSRMAGAPGDLSPPGEVAVETSFTTRIKPSSLLQCTGDEDHIHFVSASSRAMGLLLGCQPQEAELNDQHNEVPIPLATIKTEDSSSSVTVEANFKHLCEWLGARPGAQDRVSSRYLVPFLLEAMLKLLTLEVRIASHDLALQLCPRLLHFDVDLKFHVEEEQKPMKGKKAKSISEPPSLQSFSLLARTHACSVAILPISLSEENNFATTLAAGTFDGPSDTPQRCGIVCMGALVAASQRTERGRHVGVARLGPSNNCLGTLRKLFSPPALFCPPLPQEGNDETLVRYEWHSLGC